MFVFVKQRKMLRFTQVVLMLSVISLGVFSQHIFDDVEHSGDYESEVKLFQPTRPSGRKSLTVPLRSTKRTTKATTTKTTTTTTKQPMRSVELRKSDLQIDLNDFLELLPTDEIKEKIEEYYRNDMDVQHIFEYLSSKEFHELRKYLLDMQDVKEVLQYLNRKGFNVKLLIRKVGHRLGITKMRPPVRLSAHTLDSGNLGLSTK